MTPLILPTGQTFFSIGPEGDVPTAIYFSLSAKESLLTDPYNQAALYLANHGVRVLSLDLPAHGDNLAATQALSVWADQINHEIDPLTPFYIKVSQGIDYLITHDMIDPNKTALIGLSRGVMIACQVAARLEKISTILGFAPLIRLHKTKEFQTIPFTTILDRLDTFHQIPHLFNKTLRFYISNRDTRVGTDICFEFIQHLAIEAQKHGIRSPQLELFIKYPIGMHGHGTSKETFIEGANWLLDQWKKWL